MAVSNLNIGDYVDAWCRESVERLEAVWKESVQELCSIANNGVPVDTGFARASFQASTSEMPQIDPGATNKSRAAVAQNDAQVASVIASANLGDTIYAGWTAAYILPLEYGHSQQAPQGFARLAAMQWPQIVQAKLAEAKSRSGGG